MNLIKRMVAVAATAGAAVFSVAGSALAYNDTTSVAYGIGLIPMVLLGLGALGTIFGIYLRDYRMIIIGIVVMVVGVGANYLGI